MSMRFLGAVVALAALIAIPGHRSEAKPPDLPLDLTGKCRGECAEAPPQNRVILGVAVPPRVAVHVGRDNQPACACRCFNACCPSWWTIMARLGMAFYHHHLEVEQANATQALCPKEAFIQTPLRGDSEPSEPSAVESAVESAGEPAPETPRCETAGPRAVRSQFWYHGCERHECPADRCNGAWHVFFGKMFHAGHHHADRDLHMAEHYRRTGHAGAAHFYYELVRRRHAGTPHAEAAAQRQRSLVVERLFHAKPVEAIAVQPAEVEFLPIQPRVEIRPGIRIFSGRCPFGFGPSTAPAGPAVRADRPAKKLEGDAACDPHWLAQARHLFMIAEQCRRCNDMAMARTCYREVTLLCPDSTYARLARQRLADIDAESRHPGEWWQRRFLRASEEIRRQRMSEANGSGEEQEANSPNDERDVQNPPDVSLEQPREFDRDIVLEITRRRAALIAEECREESVGDWWHEQFLRASAELHRLRRLRDPNCPCPHVRQHYLNETRVVPAGHKFRTPLDLLEELEVKQAEEARRQYHEGERLRTAGQTQKAIRCFQNAHRACPSCAFGERAMKRLTELESTESGIGEEQENAQPTPKQDEARSRQILRGTVPLEIYLGDEEPSEYPREDSLTHSKKPDLAVEAPGELIVEVEENVARPSTSWTSWLRNSLDVDMTPEQGIRAAIHFGGVQCTFHFGNDGSLAVYIPPTTHDQ